MAKRQESSSRRRVRQSLDDAIGSPPSRSKAKPVTVPVEGDLLRLHRPSGQAYILVREEGSDRRRRIYLGPFYEPDGMNVSDDALQTARRLLREASIGALKPEKASGRSVARALRSRSASRITVSELAHRFLKHVEKKYANRPTQIPRYADSMRRLVEHSGDQVATKVGPVALAALRSAMVAERDRSDPSRSRHVRRSVNEMTARIVAAFRWAVSVELVPETVWRALTTLDAIEAGEEPGLRESQRITGVALDHVRSVLPHLSRQLRAVVTLQILTGARPSEILGLRPMDLDMSGERWTASPACHKNSWRGDGHDRVLVLPHEARAIIDPFLRDRLPTAPLFSPREAESERLRERHAGRKTPEGHGNVPGSSASRRGSVERKRAPGEAFTADSYRRAVHRACDAAGVDRFSPYALRHVAGELTEGQLDETHASALLGHRDERVTARYHASKQRRKRAATAADVLGVTVREALGLEESA